jgi:hypothetical protein
VLARQGSSYAAQRFSFSPRRFYFLARFVCLLVMPSSELVIISRRRLGLCGTSIAVIQRARCRLVLFCCCLGEAPDKAAGETEGKATTEFRNHKGRQARSAERHRESEESMRLHSARADQPSACGQDCCRNITPCDLEKEFGRKARQVTPLQDLHFCHSPDSTQDGCPVRGTLQSRDS